MYYLFFGAWVCFLVPLLWLKILASFLWLLAFTFTMFSFVRREFKQGFIGIALSIVVTPMFFMFGSFIQIMVTGNESVEFHYEKKYKASLFSPSTDKHNSFVMPDTQSTIKPVQPSLLTKYPKEGEKLTNNTKAISTQSLPPSVEPTTKPRDQPSSVKPVPITKETPSPQSTSKANGKLKPQVTKNHTSLDVNKQQVTPQNTQYKFDSNDPKQVKAQEYIDELRSIVQDQENSKPESITKKDSNPLPTLNISASDYTNNKSNDSKGGPPQDSKQINSSVTTSDYNQN